MGRTAHEQEKHAGKRVYDLGGLTARELVKGSVYLS